MTDFQIIITAAAILIAYQFIAIRLSKSVQSIRRSATQIGEEILSDPGASDASKRDVSFLLDRLFNSWTAWMIFVAWFLITFRSAFRRSGNHDASLGGNRMGRFVRLSILSILANSPLAALLTALLIAGRMLFLPAESAAKDARRAVRRLVISARHNATRPSPATLGAFDT